MTPVWPLWQKVLFRFFCAYFVIYIFPFPLDYVPFLDAITKYYSQLWDAFVPWTGKHLLKLPEAITVKPNGSGDTTYNYVQVLLMFSLAVITTLIWSLVDRKRENYNQAYFWLRVAVRYYLAFVMLNYGFIKVFKAQFPFPGLARMLTPFGDSSPMGLAWKFMGYSTSYNFFTGAGEVIGGFLLFFRRTTTLGALILVAVISNIVMINFSYDVPVKLFSANLLLMAFFLLVPDANRLLNFLVLNRPVPAADLSLPINDKGLKTAAIIFKVLAIVLVTGMTINRCIKSQYEWGDKRTKPPLYGIYNVETFVRNQDTLPPLTTDYTRWNNLIFDWPERATVRMMNGDNQWYKVKVDTSQQSIDLSAFNDTTIVHTLNYEKIDTGIFKWEGVFKGDTLSIKTKYFDPKNFELVKRGFNWVNEYPYNR